MPTTYHRNTSTTSSYINFLDIVSFAGQNKVKKLEDFKLKSVFWALLLSFTVYSCGADIFALSAHCGQRKKGIKMKSALNVWLLVGVVIVLFTGCAEDAHNNRGIAYHKKGQFDKAISEYTRAIEINPRHALSYYFKALSLEKIGRPMEAVEEYKEFIRYTSPQNTKYIKNAEQRIKVLGE